MADARASGCAWLPIGALLFVGGNGFVAIAAAVGVVGRRRGGVRDDAAVGRRARPRSAASGRRRREWLSLVDRLRRRARADGRAVARGRAAAHRAPDRVADLLGARLDPRAPAARSERPTTVHAARDADAHRRRACSPSSRRSAASGSRPHASTASWLALVYLCVFGSLVAFTAYNWLLRNARPVVATSYAYVNPILAVLIGAALSGEPLGVDHARRERPDRRRGDARADRPARKTCVDVGSWRRGPALSLRSPQMLRGLFRLAAPRRGWSHDTGCGGTEKPVKTAEGQEEATTEATRARCSARRATDAKAGELDAADKAYAEAYEIGKEFDILEERVDFLIHAGRATRAQDAAKAYYDANATDIKGYELYAEALLAGNKGQEALEVADQIIGLNAEDPSGHEKKGRALILLEKTDEGVDELRKAVQLDSEERDVPHLARLALHKLGEDQRGGARVPRRDQERPRRRRSARAARHGAARSERARRGEGATSTRRSSSIANNGRAYFELGLLYNRRASRPTPRPRSSKAVQKSPNESLFWYAYGEIYRVQERFDDAISAYRKAIDLDPPYPKAIAKLGAAARRAQAVRRGREAADRRRPPRAEEPGELLRARGALRRQAQAEGRGVLLREVPGARATRRSGARPGQGAPAGAQAAALSEGLERRSAPFRDRRGPHRQAVSTRRSVIRIRVRKPSAGHAVRASPCDSRLLAVVAGRRLVRYN